MFRAAKDKIRQKKEVKKLTKVLIHIYHKYFLLCRNNFMLNSVKCIFQAQQQPTKSKAPSRQKGGKNAGRVGGKR